MKTEVNLSELMILSENAQDQDLDHLEQAFWTFFPHEISWYEVPFPVREALKKIGRVLIQNARLKPSDLH